MVDSWFRRLLGAPDAVGRRHKSPPVPQPATASSSRPAVASRTNAFQAVGVVACSQACSAVGRVRGVRFLARQAPRLPLPDCDRAARCGCRFEKYADRRTTVQRSPYSNSAMVSFGGAERRRARGRRGDDR